MKYSNTIEYNINTKSNNSGLVQLQSQVKQLENSLQHMSNLQLINADTVKEAQNQLKGLNSALTNSFDSSLGIIDLSKFKTELNNAGVSASQLQSAFRLAGAEGQKTLGSLISSISDFNGGMERTSSAVDKIFTTFSNTFRWGLISSFFSNFMNAVHSSVDYVKELDDSLTQIMLVTDYNRDSMNEFARAANEAAKAVGQTTVGMTNASLIFAQQGYNLSQSQELATLSAKLANASQQDTATTSDQITAYMNAYGLDDNIQALSQALDDWALIANISAADVQELAEASQRAASMANAVGVSTEQLASQIATIESVTREAPEQIGNGLKTLYARFSDLSMGETLEDGVDLGKVTSVLDKMGIQILDKFGNMREVGQIMENLMDVWQDLDETSKIAAAQALAGKYQVNRFMALMDNADMYEEYISATGSNATGTLDVMNQEYMDSLQGRMTKLQTSLEGLFSDVFDTDNIYPFLDAAQAAIDLIQQLFDAIGGGKTILLGAISLFGRLFNQKIATSINDMMENQRLAQVRKSNIENVNDTLDYFGIDRKSDIGQYISKTAMQAKEGAINDSQYKTYQENVNKWIGAQTALTAAEEKLTDTVNAINMAYGNVFNYEKEGTRAVFRNGQDNGFNVINAIDYKNELTKEQISNIANRSQFDDVANVAAEMATHFRQLTEAQREYEKTLGATEFGQKIKTQVQFIRESLEDLRETGIIADTTIDDFHNTLETLEDTMRDEGMASEEAMAQVNGFADAIARLGKIAREMSPEEFKKLLLSGVDELQKVLSARDFAATQVAKAEADATGSAEHVDRQQQVKAILDTANAVQELTFAWQALQNLGSIWENTDLSDGEKLLQTIMNLSMVIPQVISGFSQMKSAYGSIKNIIKDSVMNFATAQANPLQKQAGELQEDLKSYEVEKAAIQKSQARVQAELAEQKAIVETARTEAEAAQAALRTAEAYETHTKMILADAEANLENAKSKKAMIDAEKDELQMLYAGATAKGLKGPELEQLKQALQLAKQANNAQKSIEASEESVRGAYAQAKIAEQETQIRREELAQTTDVLEQAEKRIADTEARLYDLRQKTLDIDTKINDVKEKIRQKTQQATDILNKYKEVIGLTKDETLTFKGAINGLPIIFEKLAASLGMSKIALAGFAVELGLVSGLLAATIWAIQEEEKQRAHQAELQQKIIDQTTTTGKALDETRGNFNQLWNEYKITEESSDEFVAALKEQCNILGITDGELLIAQGKYEELKDKIDAVTASVYQNRAAFNQFDSSALNPEKDFSDQEKRQLGLTSKTVTTTTDLSSMAPDMIGTSNTTTTNVIQEDNIEIVRRVQNQIDKVQADLNSLTNQQLQAMLNNDEVRTTQLQTQIESTMTTLGRWKELYEQYEPALIAAQESFNDRLSALTVGEDSIFQESNYDKVARAVELLAQNSGLDYNTDELALAVQKYAELANNMDLAAQASERLKEASQNNITIPENNYRSDEEQADVQKDLGLSDDEYNAYENTLISHNEYIQALSDEASYLETNQKALSEQRASLEWETKALIESRDALEEKAEKLKDNESQYASLRKEIKDYNDQIAQNQKELKKDVKTATDVQEQLDDLENKIIETAIGAKELGEVWEKNAEVLRDSSSDWAQQAEAISNIAPGLAHLLNMDLSEIQSLPESFFTSTENLNDMEAALNGSTEALQRLRSEAALELLVKAGVDPNSDLYGQMCNLIAMAQAYLPDLEAGATLDDTQFINVLNEMIATTIAAGGDIEAVLKTYERLGLQFTQTGTTTLRVPNVDYEQHVYTTIHDPEHGNMSLPAAKAVVTWSEYEVPVYEYKKTSGGSGFTGGYTPKSSGGGGGGGGSCFVAGTLISMYKFFKNIEDIRPGDIVLSYNEKTHQNEYSEVRQTMIHWTQEEIYTIQVEDEKLRVTGIHRFFVLRNNILQWIQAQELQVGDLLLFANGSWHSIVSMDINIERRFVYNFEVSNNHNYYVGRNQILAHNKGGGGGGGGGGGSEDLKSVEQKEKEKAEKKYYEEVDHQLEKTQKILSKIEKQRDKLLGDAARANMNKQIQLLQKEIQLQEKKLKILEEQEQIDVGRDVILGYANFDQLLAEEGINFELASRIYDEDGFIKNTDAIEAEIIESINALIEKRNKLAEAGEVDTATYEEIQRIDKQIDKLKEYGSEITKNIYRLNDMRVEVEEINNTIQELKDSINDLRIEAFKAAQEALNDIVDFKKEQAELNSLFYDAAKGEKFLSKNNPYRELKKNALEMKSVYEITGKEAKAFYDELINEKKQLLSATTDENEKKAIQSSIEFFEQMKNQVDEEHALNNGYMQLAQNNLLQLKELYENWDENGDNPIFGDNKEALLDALKEAYKTLKDLVLDWEELILDYQESILDIYDWQNKQLERQLDKMERVNDSLERYKDMYTLVYGDESYDMLSAVNKQEAQNLVAQINQAQANAAYWRQEYQDAVAAFTDPLTGLVKDGFQDYVAEIEDKMNEAEDTVKDLAQDAAEKFMEAYEAAVKNATQTLNKTLFGEKTLNYLTQSWEWEKEYIEKYRDDVEKAYEMDKLRARYIDMLNNAQGASLQTQNKIRAQMQEQLDYLENQTTLSEYDVKLANAKLEVLQKQIALEDAQRNKNKMQLRRDTQGNYRYVYTANKDDIAQAEQDLLDSEYNAYEISKEQQIRNYDELLNAYQRYVSQMEAIALDRSLSEEERVKKQAELTEKFTQYYKALEEDFNDTTAGLVDVLNWMVVNSTLATSESATEMLNQLLDDEGNVLQQSGIIWMDHATEISEVIIPKMEDAITQYMMTIEAEGRELEDALVSGSNAVFPAVSEGARDFGQACDIAKDATIHLTNETNNLRNALLGDNAALVEAKAELQRYAAALEGIAEKSSTVGRALIDTQQLLDKANEENLNYRTQIDRLLTGEDVIYEGRIISKAELESQLEAENAASSGGGGGGWDPYGDAYDIWINGAWGGGGYWYGPYAAANGEWKADQVLDLFNSGYGYYWMDTGGYTGTWSSTEGLSDAKNGKLAVLHQKELVLNATDTENILNAVSMVREMVDILKGTASITANMLANKDAKQDSTEVIEQRVEISATFPNATDADDIRQALLGLSDRAYQYAHKTI